MSRLLHPSQYPTVIDPVYADGRRCSLQHRAHLEARLVTVCAMSFVLCGTGEGIAQQAFENHGADLRAHLSYPAFVL